MIPRGLVDSRQEVLEGGPFFLNGQAGLDLSTPPTQAEITEAEAATRIFPRWGDPDLELARLGLGKG